MIYDNLKIEKEIIIKKMLNSQKFINYTTKK